MTFMFLVVILGTTHKRAPVGFAGLAIGLALTLIHLISIPVTNTSVNPARSTATALFVGGWALQQLWLFWLAPVIGAAIAGFVSKAILEGSVEEPPVTGRTSFLTHLYRRRRPPWCKRNVHATVFRTYSGGLDEQRRWTAPKPARTL